MKSLCPNKDVCGSCSWSHIPYEKQLEQKLSDINGTFKLKELDLQVEEIIPSPETAHYRNRMDFVIDFEGRMGLREKGKWWRVIDNHTCFISDQRIEEAFHTVRDWTKTAELSFFDRKAHTGFLRYAVIRKSLLDELMIIIVTSAPADDTERERALKQLNLLAEQSEATTLVWSINHTITDVSFGDELHTISGPGYITEMISGFQYRVSPHAFFQTNSYGASRLVETVAEFAGDLSNKTLLDLYCGSGFFSIHLAGKAKKTVGVELNAEAIADARENVTLNQKHNLLATDVDIEYFDAKTEDYDWSVHDADVVILDPPRSGMHDSALADVIKNAPQTIIYVSCNPKHFAREMVQLQEIYDVSAMRAIDMFPHTPHVELVTRLDKKQK